MGLFRKGKTRITANFDRNDLVICSHSREGKPPSYSQINRVKEVFFSCNQPQFERGGGLLLIVFLGLFTVFLWLQDRAVSVQNHPKNLDLSYKTDLDLWDCLGRVKLVLQQILIEI